MIMKYGKKIAKRYVSVMIALGLISVLIITANPVSACHYTIRTFEDDYTTSKDSFFKGETVYGKGEAYGHHYLLKLRIRDPDGNVVYYSNESKYVVYGSFFLNDSAKVGTWNIQLGIKKCGWKWSTEYGRIAYFSVSDANFSLTLNVNGNGSVFKDPDEANYSYGTIVDLTAVPDLGWSFVSWSGDLSGTSSSMSIVIDGDKSVVALFMENHYILDIVIDGNGDVSKNPDKDFYVYGDIVNLTAIPLEGSTFDHWSGNLSGNCNPIMINMTENKNVTAHFVMSSENGGNGDNGGNGVISTGGGGGKRLSGKKPNEPPIADLSAGELYIGFINEEIDLNGTLSYDHDGYIIEWLWDFGDGTTAFGEITSHAYPSPGEYIVILKVTDDKGANDTDNTTAVIIQPNRPPSELSINGTTEGFVKLEYMFSIVSIDDDNDKIKYIIDWGDGSSDESDFMQSGDFFNISHKWTQPGEYLINVSADDNDTITKIDFTITIDKQDIPEESNIALIFILFLGLLLLLLFLILLKPQKDEKEEENEKNN